MLYNLYMFDHNVLHMCFWTLPSILIGIAMIAIVLLHNHKQKKREEAFEEKMEEADAKLTSQL